MFGAAYFAPAYFGPHYFGGEGGDIIVVPPPSPPPSLTTGIILYSDRIATAILSGSATPSTLPIYRLQDPQPTNITRFLASTAFLVADLGAAAEIGAIVFHGTNLGITATARYRLSSADPTGAAGDVYDSGVILAGADPRYRGSFAHVLAANSSARYLRVDLDNPTASTIDLGLWLAGAPLRTAINFSPPRPLGYRDYGAAAASQSGIVHTARRRRARVIEMRFDWADEAEAMGDVSFFDMQGQCGVVENVAVISDPSSSYRAAELVVGLVTALIPISIPTRAQPRRLSCTINVTERL